MLSLIGYLDEFSLWLWWKNSFSLLKLFCELFYLFCESNLVSYGVFSNWWIYVYTVVSKKADASEGKSKEDAEDGSKEDAEDGSKEDAEDGR